MPKRALITGITGQDGSYLAEFLLNKGYEVYGMVRRTSFTSEERICHLQGSIHFVRGDLIDQSLLLTVLEEVQPDEIYNLAAQSFLGDSWKQPVLTAESTGVGAAKLLEAVRIVCPGARFYQASSSELFGTPLESPQTENTPFNPRNPYGAAKVYAHWMTLNYRSYHKLFTVSGILYNHESPRRGIEFVTRKITHGAASIKLGRASELQLGNLDARRDWGFAGDYVRAIWLMLQQDTPQDFVIATGCSHSVREFCEIAFNYVGLNYRDWVVFNPGFDRPVESKDLVGDSSKAKRMLGWEPETGFRQLVEMMVEADLAALKKADIAGDC
ncbi:MAG: GDP-mannose 4,6-dehydratase [Anaerolineales bacterium]|nr:GDP-mannose 4,6-dehydratase [Anaerolineales bacterium]